MQYSKFLSAGCKYRALHTTFNELSVSCNVFNISVVILLIVQLLFLILFSLYVSLVSSLPDKTLITKYYFRYCDILLESPFRVPVAMVSHCSLTAIDTVLWQGFSIVPLVGSLSAYLLLLIPVHMFIPLFSNKTTKPI